MIIWKGVTGADSKMLSFLPIFFFNKTAGKENADEKDRKYIRKGKQYLGHRYRRGHQRRYDHLAFTGEFGPELGNKSGALQVCKLLLNSLVAFTLNRGFGGTCPTAIPLSVYPQLNCHEVLLLPAPVHGQRDQPGL